MIRRWWGKHHNLIGYILIVLVAVIAVEIHHVKTTRDIRRENRLSCERATIVAANQRIVLNTLLIQAGAADAGSKLRARLPKLQKALANVPDQLCEQK